jgi:Polysaccharide lyase
MQTFPLRTTLSTVAVLLLVGGLAGSARGEVVRRLDYETGNLSQWDAVQSERGRITIVRKPVRQRRYAARFVVRPGDEVSGGERAEVLARANEREGTVSLWRWSTKFPRGFRPTDNSFNVFVQWHHDGGVRGCGPPILFRIHAGERYRVPRIQLSVSGGDVDRGCNALDGRVWNLAKLRRGRWYDFSFYVRWSASRARGVVGVVLNGRRVLRRTHAATLFKGYGVYLKQGFYRRPVSYSTVVYHDGTRRLRP